MKIACQIVRGPEHAECEDHALVCQPGNPAGSQVLNVFRGELTAEIPGVFAVADGVGGNPGGHEASGFVLRDLMEKAKDLKLSSEDKEAEKTLQELIHTLNGDLVSQAQKTPGKEIMATTFTALFMNEGGAWYLHTGNTRLQVMSGIFIKQITSDHTTYQWLMDSGAFEAAEHCNRCEIQSCLGAGSPRYLTMINAKRFREAGDLAGVYLLSSDGVHEYTSADFMEEIMGRDDISDLEKTDAIIAEARKNGSLDDTTIMIIRV